MHDIANAMSPYDKPDDDAPDAAQIIASMLEQGGDLAALMEFAYLAREPGLLEIMRFAATLPDETRTHLLAFARRTARDRRTVRADAAETALTLKLARS